MPESTCLLGTHTADPFLFAGSFFARTLFSSNHLQVNDAAFYLSSVEALPSRHSRPPICALKPDHFRFAGSFSGRTPFASGYLQVNDVHYKVNLHDDILASTVTATQPQTLYLWTTFTVANASCYRNLALGIKAKDGFAVYLNAVLVLEQGLMYNGTGLQYSTQVRSTLGLSTALHSGKSQSSSTKLMFEKLLSISELLSFRLQLL
jgi:hypothetical protein